MAALRREAEGILLAAEPARRPALRRVAQEDWLLATDLPQLAPPEALQRVRDRLESLGWRVCVSGGWLLMDALPPAPAEADPPPLAGEAACAVSVLRRHPCEEMDFAALRGLLKASEGGLPQVEKCCARLHRQLAERLRRGIALPGGLLPWLIQILWEVSE